MNASAEKGKDAGEEVCLPAVLEGLGFKAHRLSYRSTLGSRVIKKQTRPYNFLHFASAIAILNSFGVNLSHILYLLISFRTSTPPQNRLLNISMSNSKQ